MAAQAYLQQYPELQRYFELTTFAEMCASWGDYVGTAVAEANEAVSSDVDILLLSGAYDAITPPSWGRLAAETLPNHALYEFPHMGHSLSFVYGCPRETAVTFIENPAAVDETACLAGIDKPLDFVTSWRGPDLIGQIGAAFDSGIRLGLTNLQGWFSLLLFTLLIPFFPMGVKQRIRDLAIDAEGPRLQMSVVRLTRLFVLIMAVTGLTLLVGSLVVYHRVWDKALFSVLPSWTDFLSITVVFIRYLFVAFVLLFLLVARRQPWGRNLWLQIALLTVTTANVMIVVWNF